MATTHVIVELRRAALLAAGADMGDAQLLEGFLARRDDAAFEQLVHRHGPMVLGVCRRVIGNIHDAEDAFQATFLVLARKAACVLPREAVGNWLYGVAYRTARRAKAVAARRCAREKQVPAMPQSIVEAGNARHDVDSLLDEELTRLPDKYRLPVVLCELEGRSRKEVAQRLRLPEGTLSSRLATARKLLAQRLTKRGVTVSGGVLAGMLTAEAACASVPGVLVSNTLKAASLVAAGQAATAIVSPAVAALSEGVLRAMFLTKLKIAVSMILVALLIGAGVLLQRTAAQPPGAAQQQSQRSGQAKGKPAANPLIGSWKLISAKYAGQESDLPQTKTTLKHMTPVHYIWVSFGDDGQVYRTGGGPYTFDGETLKSTPEYGFGSSFEAIKGKMQMYKCKVDGNRWHQSGTLSTGETLEEVWERVDKK